jgi:hypothetical protein
MPRTYQAPAVWHERFSGATSTIRTASSMPMCAYVSYALPIRARLYAVTSWSILDPIGLERKTSMPKTSAKRLSVKAICLAAVTFVTVAVTAGVAWAAYTDNMYPTQYARNACIDEGSNPVSGAGMCQTDNSSLSYYMDSAGSNSLEANDRSAVNNVLTNVYGPTDLSVAYDSTPAFSGSAETDIVYEESAAGMSSSADGTTFCNDAADNLRCDQQYIRIRPSGNFTKGMVCHETGHAIGLTHGDQASPKKSRTDEALGCMETPTDADEGLQANNIENINATY